MAHLDISLLGHFAVTLDGQPPIHLRTDKIRALLAYLVVESDRDHRREMLAGLLWPDVSEEAARHNLSQALFMLRQALSDEASLPMAATPPFFLTTRQTLRWNPASDYTLDVAEFQAELATCTRTSPDRISSADARILAQAMERRRGEFLSMPLHVDSETFEEWQLLKQTQIHMLTANALDYLAGYHELRGEFALVAHYARQHVALEPLCEQSHRQLMAALALDGRRPEALAHYAAYQALLVQELGIEPAPETTALAEQIRAARLAGALLPSNRQRENPGTGPSVSPPAFVGRACELARLDGALQSALAGRGWALFVTGDAGSGKSALLDAFARHALAAHPDVLIINGSGNAYTGLGDPYWPFIEALRQLSGDTDGPSTLSRAQAQRLDVAHPSILRTLAESSPDLARSIASGLKTVAPGLFDQITRVLHAVASHYPLVMLLDDLQWADRESLNLLLHLGRRLTGQRILIVGAFRPDALDRGHSTPIYLHEQDGGQRHPLATVVNELQRLLGDMQIDLAQTEGRAFVDALLDSEPNHLRAEFRETLYRHTGGHALFTTELLREMQARGDLVRDGQGYWIEGPHITWDALPARVEAVIAECIGQLPPDWQAMLALASVEGDEFTVQVLARAQGRPESEISRRLSGALTHHHLLVVPVGVQRVGEQRLDRYRFRHLLVQRYLYDRQDPVERAHLHLSVGDTLETCYGERASEISLSLARHFELGGAADKAITYLIQAARRATHLTATEEALRLLAHGLALLRQLETSPARAQQKAELQLALGQVESAHATLEQTFI